MTYACDRTIIARAAGAELTRPRLRDAVPNLGLLDLAKMSVAGFRPGKFDLPETVRPIQWDADCRCFRPIGEFVPTKH